MRGKRRQCPAGLRGKWALIMVGIVLAVIIGFALPEVSGGRREKIGAGISGQKTAGAEEEGDALVQKAAGAGEDTFVQETTDFQERKETGVFGPAGRKDRAQVHPEGTGEEERQEIQGYEDFLHRMEAVRTRAEIEEKGFRVFSEHIFPLELAGSGQVFLIPAMDPECRRMVLFFAREGEGGEIIFRTERLEANVQAPGRLKQRCRNVAAVSFPDIDGDGRADVVMITVCNDAADGTGVSYKVGDVLFQGEEGFYRDWRLSERINRYGMNKSVRQILSFVTEGQSAVSWYTAATRDELAEHGFVEETGRSFRVNFEKLGELLVLPGYYRMAEYHILMVYLIQEDGRIVWNFQPMGEFENLYELLGLDCRDIDGDGLKDITVLARYTYDTPSGEMMTEKDYTIYYQRTGGFTEDTELKSRYQCGEAVTMEELVVLARSFWGWGVEHD